MLLKFKEELKKISQEDTIEEEENDIERYLDCINYK